MLEDAQSVTGNKQFLFFFEYRVEVEKGKQPRVHYPAKPISTDLDATVRGKSARRDGIVWGLP